MQPARSVVIEAPCRLHFGLLTVGAHEGRNFGGVGLMVHAPGLQVRVAAELGPSPTSFETGAAASSGAPEPHESPDVSAALSLELQSGHGLKVDAEGLELPAGGNHAARAEEFARQFLERAALTSEQRARAGRARLRVQAPRDHIGLGVGTALGLAVSEALAGLAGVGLSPRKLAAVAGRGRRSAIGVHGYFQGGFLVEGGKQRPEAISPLAARAELPSKWRCLLLLPRSERGLSGESERTAFRELPSAPPALTAEMCRETLMHLLPAAAEADFAEFAASLQRYGRLAGEMFASRQHGCFATQRSAAMAQWLQSRQAPCVVQSSWGPTLAMLLPTPEAAESWRRRFATEPSDSASDVSDWEVVIARPFQRPRLRNLDHD